MPQELLKRRHTIERDIKKKKKIKFSRDHKYVKNGRRSFWLIGK